ncbi:MAG: SAM-dependent methyltransferase [Lentimicrobiaceae bacterium]|nr:SAM-dependent methyltransferase [Lentimicrobiaceae bacterium]
MNSSRVYLIPTPIADGNTCQAIPKSTINIIHSLNIFIVEELRTARRFLSSISYPRPINEVVFFVLNEHTNKSDFISEIATTISAGNSVGMMSEAGTPCIADPGNWFVSWAHNNNYKVIPLLGTSSITMALMASGLNGQQFTFNGYLPVRAEEKIPFINSLVSRISKNNYSQIFIETPYRNNSIIDTLLKTVPNHIYLCIASDISGENEFIKTLTIADWKKQKPILDKKPTVFILGLP